MSNENKGFEVQLGDWLKSVEGAALTSAADREKVTKAGAKALADNLEAATRARHDSGFVDSPKPHLAETVTSNPTDVDGRHDGTATVGFSAAGKKAYIARFLNDGTVYRTGDHFVDTARRESVGDVVAAERAAYKKLMGGK